MYHSFYIMDQYIGIQLYQYLYLQQQTLTMILTRESIGWKKSLFTSPGWRRNENVWKSLEGIMVNGVPREVPRSKTLGACGPSGFCLGTSPGTPFTMIPPRLFHTLSHSFIHWLIQSSFSSKPSKHHYTQTIRARELFWGNVHPPPCVACQVSSVTCHVSHVSCHV